MIFKIGGSVAGNLKEIFEALENLEDAKVIPGGWIFADIVEKLGLNDELSHWMAVLSMNLYGYYMLSYAKGFKISEPESFEDIKRKGKIIILPYRIMKKFDELPHSWDVTSDSIAIWIAGKIGEKRVVKVTAAGGVIKEGRIVEFARAEEAVKAGIIDRFAPMLLKNHSVELFICSPSELKNYIFRGEALGTFVRGD
uniref:Uridylate kinase n=1 Tax=Archaeoglobus fulgidus TaxID=2234 RepID=A0A7J2TLQ3_ARCFL